MSSTQQLGIVAGTAVSRDTLRVLRALERAKGLELPGPDELMALRPPQDAREPHTAIYGRRVEARKLWGCYRATRNLVGLVGATGTPIPPK